VNERFRIMYWGRCPICGHSVGRICDTEKEAEEEVRKHYKEKHWKEAEKIELIKIGMLEKHTVDMHLIETDGFILDIGGGGEGIIGRLNGRQVVAIDPSSSELEEAKNESLKVVMDATDLKFLPKTFNVATSFFTLMFIENSLHSKVFSEIHRVLKENGRFLLWDARIPKRVEDAIGFGIRLEIVLSSEKVETSYGTKWENKEQNIEYFKELATRTGFKVMREEIKGEVFFLELVKQSS